MTFHDHSHCPWLTRSGKLFLKFQRVSMIYAFCVGTLYIVQRTTDQSRWQLLLLILSLKPQHSRRKLKIKTNPRVQISMQLVKPTSVHSPPRRCPCSHFPQTVTVFNVIVSQDRKFELSRLIFIAVFLLYAIYTQKYVYKVVLNLNSHYSWGRITSVPR